MHFEFLEPRRLLSGDVIDVSLIGADNSIINSGESAPVIGPLSGFNGGTPVDATIAPSGTTVVAETVNDNIGIKIGSHTGIADLGGIEKVHNVTPLDNGKEVVTGRKFRLPRCRTIQLRRDSRHDLRQWRQTQNHNRRRSRHRHFG
jgi:hypothetical protein